MNLDLKQGAELFQNFTSMCLLLWVEVWIESIVLRFGSKGMNFRDSQVDQCFAT